MTPVFVGASCLPGLIGDVAAPLVLEDDVIAHLGWDLPQHVSQFFTPATVLVTACAAVLAFGWVPGTRLGSTSARVVAALSAHGSPRAREALAAHLPQGRELVAGWTDPMSRVPWLGPGVGPRDVGRVLAVYAAELAGQESFAEKGK